MLRVLLATGDVELDGAIASALAGKGAEMAGECRTREDAACAAAEPGADVVVLSPRLPGRTGVVELVRSLIAAGLRVVLLAGARADAAAQSLAREAISLGVYDVIWDPIAVDQVVQRILTPAAPAEAGVVRGEGATGSGGVAGESGQKVPIWRRLFRRGEPAGHPKGSSRPAAGPAAGAPGGLAAVVPGLEGAAASLPGETITLGGAGELFGGAARPGPASSPVVANPGPGAAAAGGNGPQEAVWWAPAVEAPEAPDAGLVWEDEEGDERAAVAASGAGGMFRDPLTGCFTRQCLESLDLKPPCSVVFVDLDGFKEVNDTLGHDAGDRVLAAFGAVLRENLKGKDVPIRWGGDEFVLVLPATDRVGAERVVEGLRRAWRDSAPDTGNLEVGFSAGVAEWRGGPLEAAIKEADRLMYAEKKNRKARKRWEEVRGRAEEPFYPAAWRAERAGGAGVSEAVRQGFSLAAYAVLALGLVSGCIWLADLAARLFGVHAPVLREAAKVVEGFWGLVLAGVRG